eukprot:GHVS01036402.1.p1 GENE.GHVS01036402.1~~GHVS01036402.1.p1  ORF type:complete len:296 (+),score=56.35 GHVS01036402.1:316-1203(+)
MEIVEGLPPLPPSYFIQFSSSSSCSSPATSLPSSDYPTDGDVDSDASPSSLSSLQSSHTNHINTTADISQTQPTAPLLLQTNKQAEFPTIPTSAPPCSSPLPPYSSKDRGTSICLTHGFTKLLLFMLSVVSVVIISELSSPLSSNNISSYNLRQQQLPHILQQTTNQIPSSLIVRASLHLSRRSSLHYNLTFISSAQFSTNVNLAIIMTASRRGGDKRSADEHQMFWRYCLPMRVLRHLWQSIVQTSMLITSTLYSLLSVLCCGGCGVGLFCLWLSGGSAMPFMLWIKAVIVLLI